MNKRICCAGLVMALTGLVSIWALDGTILPAAAAATSQSHAGHEHGGGLHAASSQHEDLDALFEEDEHEEHAPAAAHGEERHDEHDGHGHGEPVLTRAEHGHDEHDHGGHSDGGGICPEHRVPEEEDALCHGDHLADLQPGEGMKLRLVAPDVAAKAGIALAEPQVIFVADGIDIPGRVQFNRNRLAHITPLSAGIVQQVHVQPGEKVARGDLLAQIATPEIASLRAQLLAAQARQAQTEATYLREKDLLDRGISSRQEFQQAEAEFREAQSAAEQYRQQLLNYGLTATELEHLVRDGLSSAILHLRAPFAGTVVEVNTAGGEAVTAGAPLFTVADLDSLWIELSVPERYLYQSQFDASVQARFNGLPGKVFTGKIFQAGAVVDERTRTLKVLAEMKNPQHRLKVGMYGSARILAGLEQQALAVPAAALQSIDGASYVFIQKEADLFELRRVQAGAVTDGMIPVLAGLSRDDQVVVSQGFALKSEVLKARLGASCADH